MPFGTITKTQYKRSSHARKERTLTKPQKKAVGVIVEKKIKRDGELKYHDTVAPSYVVNRVNTTDSWYSYYCLTNIPQGFTDTTRSGDNIDLTSGTVRLAIQQSTASSANDSLMLRIVIFQYHPVVDGTYLAPPGPPFGMNGALPLNLIFQPGVSGNIDFSSNYNVDRKSQYHVLYDKVTKLVKYTTSVPGVINLKINLRMKKARKKVAYINGSTTQAAEHLFLLVMSNSNDSIANPAGMYAVTRLRFMDS